MPANVTENLVTGMCTGAVKQSDFELAEAIRRCTCLIGGVAAALLRTVIRCCDALQVYLTV